MPLKMTERLLEVRIAAAEVSLLQTVEDFRQIMMTEFEKLRNLHSCEGVHSFSYVEDSVSESKMMRKKEADPDGNRFEGQTGEILPIFQSR